MKWYEHTSQVGNRVIFELQLSAETLDDLSFARELKEMSEALQEWLSIRKNRATDIYILVRSIRKYHTPLVDYWNALKENEFTQHAKRHKSLSGRIDIEDALSGSQQSYHFSPLAHAAD